MKIATALGEGKRTVLVALFLARIHLWLYEECTLLPVKLCCCNVLIVLVTQLSLTGHKTLVLAISFALIVITCLAAQSHYISLPLNNTKL